MVFFQYFYDFVNHCNMYDCLLIPPRMNVNLFKNTASQLFRH
jgi:hypothetical protein